jgi:hypothetical protein
MKSNLGWLLPLLLFALEVAIRIAATNIAIGLVLDHLATIKHRLFAGLVINSRKHVVLDIEFHYRDTVGKMDWRVRFRNGSMQTSVEELSVSKQISAIEYHSIPFDCRYNSFNYLHSLLR